MSDQEKKVVRFDPDKIVVLSPAFDFWLNEEDDIYNSYAEQKSVAPERPSQQF